MKHAIRSLLALCVVSAFLWGASIYSQWILAAASLYVVYVMVAAVSVRLRSHRYTRETQVIMLFASVIFLLIWIAGAVVVVRVPLSKTAAIGVGNHYLFCDWLPTSLRHGRLAGKVGPPPRAEFGFQSVRNPKFLSPPVAWSRSGSPTLLPLGAVVVPTGLFWLIRKKMTPPGRCPNCEYDLTGNTSGVCPECGAPCKAAAKVTE